MIRFDAEECRDLDSASTREWLETNGIGGFASSTINGLNTRRYHGLLVAATRPPVGRLVMLSKLEETLVIEGRRYELSTNKYPGVIHPQGYTLQTGFRLAPFPVFTYTVEGITIEKSLFMIQGENSTVIEYEVQSPNSRVQSPSLSLELRPLVAWMLEENGFPITPLILGVVLGGMLEDNFISSMIKADGNLLAFFSRPIAA